MKVRGKCVEWVGHCNRDGYGVKKIKGKHYRVHRLAWEAANGPIPEGLCVLHHCDNPSCIRLSHLFLGTRADNLRDAREKERLPTAKHGSKAMYDKHHCHCVLCKKAAAKQHIKKQNKRHAKLKAGLVPKSQHGTFSCYSRYGCRCKPCTTANAKKCREYRQEKRRNGN